MRTPPPYRELAATLREIGVVSSDAVAVHAMRARVRRALASLIPTGEASRVRARRMARQHTILTRCDLGGELHKVVASDLGVSMRTLYRDRIDAFRTLRGALDREPVEASETIVRDGVALRIERAWDQALLGRTREAIVRLEEIATSAAPALLCVVYARLAAARIMAGEFARATDALARAKRTLAMLGPGVASAVAEAEILLVESRSLADNGALERALHAYARIEGTLRLHAPKAEDTARNLLLARLETHLARGEASAALELAHGTNVAASREGVSTTPFELAVTMAIIECTLLLDGDPALVATDAIAASETASQSGMSIAAARALTLAARAHAATFDVREGLALLRDAASAMRDVPKGRQSADVLLEIAAGFAETGDGEHGFALASACAQEAPANSFWFARAVRIQGEALLRLGDRTEAARHADAAVSMLSAFQSRRALGEALLTVAECAAACGERRLARTSAMRALPLLRGATWPQRVALATRLGEAPTLRARGPHRTQIPQARAG